MTKYEKIRPLDVIVPERVLNGWEAFGLGGDSYRCSEPREQSESRASRRGPGQI